MCIRDRVIFVTTLIVRPLLAMLTVYELHWGLYGAWIALVADQLLRTLLILSLIHILMVGRDVELNVRRENTNMGEEFFQIQDLKLSERGVQVLKGCLLYTYGFAARCFRTAGKQQGANQKQ